MGFVVAIIVLSLAIDSVLSALSNYVYAINLFLTRSVKKTGRKKGDAMVLLSQPTGNLVGKYFCPSSFGIFDIAPAKPQNAQLKS